MITITDRAKQELITALQADNATIVRFGLKGGGCSGFQYFFTIDPAKEDDDSTFPLNDTCALVVDVTSSMYLQGATIDYKDELMGSGFVFNNPSASTSCGCGQSFTI